MDVPLKRLLPVALLGTALLALMASGRFGPTAARPLDDFGEAPAFQLLDHLSRDARSDELRGKVVVANFIYTNCTDICPLLSVRMKALQGRLQTAGLLGSQVQLLSFTVDPARDTPEVLRAYAERHQADPDGWRFLTGPEDAVIPLVVEGFRLGVQALPPEGGFTNGGGESHDGNEGYEVMHTGRFVLIDPDWHIRAYYDGRDLDLDHVVQDVRRLLE